MHQPQTFVSKPVVVQAIQWTGDNLRAVQDFVAPQSPGCAPDHQVLTVRVPDKASMEKYPALGAQFKLEQVPLQAWVIKRENGDLDVVVAKDFEARYVALAEDAENLDDPAEQIGRTLGYRTMDPVIIDPLQVVLLDRQPEVDAAGDVVDRAFESAEAIGIPSDPGEVQR